MFLIFLISGSWSWSYWNFFQIMILILLNLFSDQDPDSIEPFCDQVPDSIAFFLVYDDLRHSFVPRNGLSLTRLGIKRSLELLDWIPMHNMWVRDFDFHCLSFFTSGSGTVSYCSWSWRRFWQENTFYNEKSVAGRENIRCVWRAKLSCFSGATLYTGV